jgi:hypothetical protein
MFKTLRLFVYALLLAAGPLGAQDYIPEELEGWQQWVLKDKAYRNCPFLYNGTPTNPADFLCAWPGELQLEASAGGARFSQSWTVLEEDQWIALPGSTAHWPDQVTANGRAVTVTARNGAPSVRLAPGSWRLAGRFEWDERPDVLRIPPESGLLSLIVDGQPVARPEFDGGRVFLGTRTADTRTADSVRAVVYRLVIDDVPTRLVTRVRIDVSGSVREEAFGPLLPEGFVPLDLQSRIPAKFEPDGTLHLQVRPGSWEIQLAARAPASLNEIPAPATGSNLPDTEIWSYRSNQRLRVTAAGGVPPVDPAQADVPGDWRSFPAFRVTEDATLSITERSRGVIAASNELALQRTLWLDFDGADYSVRDSITGRMRTDWRLDMVPPFTLLSATEDGDNLLVTKGPEEGQTGVEIRTSDVRLATLGRSETRGAMPATGWDARFAAVDGTLNLPPGYKLVMAPGVDRAIGSWTDNWALLDFFLVLIITIATWRLFGPAAGSIALLALVLSFHEMYAPTWLWLNLLVAVALLRVAPAGRLFQAVRSYQLLSAAALVLVLVPFIAGQLRTAIYPQLEPQQDRFGLVDAEIAYEQADEAAGAMQVARPQVGALKPPETRETTKAPLEEMVVMPRSSHQSFARYAPNAIVQAGPGIPSWRWNTYQLKWSGPVDPGQEVRLVVMPRWLVSVLRFAAVGLSLMFAAILAAEIAQRRWTLPGGMVLGRDMAAGSLAMLALGATLLAASPSADAQFPDQDLLRQLEERLLELPDCVPGCAEIAAASVEVDTASVSMELSIHARQSVAVPLPGAARGWRPVAVLVDGAGDIQLRRNAYGTLMILVPEGRHRVSLRGPVPAADSLEIEFPAPPRVVTVDSDGWLVAGVKDRRLLSGSLQLTRLQTGSDADEVRWEASRFPAFARITRTISMDADWRVETRVQRVAPAQGALSLTVPLLDGESIVSADFEVSEGQVLVSMAPEQSAVSWSSTLPLESPLRLQAPAGVPWTESWHVVVGSIWNVTFDGVPESNTGNEADSVRRAEFDPRAGEELVVTAERPEASAGSTLAFDAVRLDMVPGNRSSDVTLQLAYRSTRGAQHVIQLPDAAQVTAVVIDGREHSLRPEDNELTVPILPGEHSIEVSWRASGGMGWHTQTPLVDLGAPAGNIELTMSRAGDRWLLATRGPRLGPAVLYWTELAVMLLFAVILGRVGLAPLSTRHWLFLGLGFSTFSWPALAVVTIWLLACGAREKFGSAGLKWWGFNVVQVVIGLLTVYALLSILAALPQGLLGTPDMHVTGHESHANLLSWFADRSTSALPRAAAFTVPMWIYKAIILVWALWLSFALVRWLPWVWKCFSSDGFWRKRADT